MSILNRPPIRRPVGPIPVCPAKHLKLRLELKLIADVGLVGYPNAGKSSLLKAMSRAQPKIADYPFTTLSPNIGIVEIAQYRTIRMADIPGIITGASHGKGLGLKFLRHIERTKVLLYMLDGSNEDFLEDYRILQKELENYNWRLPTKPTIVCVNKIDLWSAEELEEHKAKLGSDFLYISAKENINLDDIRRILLEMNLDKEKDDIDV